MTVISRYFRKYCSSQSQPHQIYWSLTDTVRNKNVAHGVEFLVICGLRGTTRTISVVTELLLTHVYNWLQGFQRFLFSFSISYIFSFLCLMSCGTIVWCSMHSDADCCRMEYRPYILYRRQRSSQEAHQFCAEKRRVGLTHAAPHVRWSTCVDCCHHSSSCCSASPSPLAASRSSRKLSFDGLDANELYLNYRSEFNRSLPSKLLEKVVQGRITSFLTVMDECRSTLHI